MKKRLIGNYYPEDAFHAGKRSKPLLLSYADFALAEGNEPFRVLSSRKGALAEGSSLLDSPLLSDGGRALLAEFGKNPRRLLLPFGNRSLLLFPNWYKPLGILPVLLLSEPPEVVAFFLFATGRTDVHYPDEVKAGSRNLSAFSKLTALFRLVEQVTGDNLRVRLSAQCRAAAALVGCGLSSLSEERLSRAAVTSAEASRVACFLCLSLLLFCHRTGAVSADGAYGDELPTPLFRLTVKQTALPQEKNGSTLSAHLSIPLPSALDTCRIAEEEGSLLLSLPVFAEGQTPPYLLSSPPLYWEIFLTVTKESANPSAKFTIS